MVDPGSNSRDQGSQGMKFGRVHTIVLYRGGGDSVEAEVTCVLSLCCHVVGNGRLLCSQIDCCVYNLNQLLHRSKLSFQQTNPCDCGLPAFRARPLHTSLCPSMVRPAHKRTQGEDR